MGLSREEQEISHAASPRRRVAPSSFPSRFTRICIVTAVEIEFKTAAGLLADKAYSNESHMKVCRGCRGDRQITILKSEIGAVGFANLFSAHLEKNKYDALIIAGLAGAIDPKLRAGDAVIYDLCIDARSNVAGSNSREKQFDCEEIVSIACNDEISRLIIDTLRLNGHSCFRGVGVTVDRIVNRAQDKVSLGIRYNAVAVDMESFDILSICAMAGLGATALRIISDEAERDLPNFNLALGPDGTMNNWRLASAVLMSPIGTLRLLLNIKPAMNSLKDKLKAVLNA